MEPEHSAAILRAVVSNTGPLISALQSDCVFILRQFYDLIHIPASELAEFEGHGATEEIQGLMESGFIVTHDLTESERQTAQAIADEIARSARSKNKEPVHHYPEAAAIALMERGDLGAMELLVDELAAREVAQRRGVDTVGFPGLLIRTCQQGLMTPEQVRDALADCQRQGTHYSNRFIAEVYQRLKEG